LRSPSLQLQFRATQKSGGKQGQNFGQLKNLAANRKQQGEQVQDIEGSIYAQVYILKHITVRKWTTPSLALARSSFFVVTFLSTLGHTGTHKCRGKKGGKEGVGRKTTAPRSKKPHPDPIKPHRDQKNRTKNKQNRTDIQNKAHQDQNKTTDIYKNAPISLKTAPIS